MGMTIQKAEEVSALLVARGYSARPYQAFPTGHKVVVLGRQGKAGFTYTINRAEDLAQALADLERGNIVGEGALAEGE